MVFINKLLRRSNSLPSKETYVLVAQSCPILCDFMDYSPPGSSVHGILQARTLEWVAIRFSRESFWRRDWTWVSCVVGIFFTVWATKEKIYLHRYRVPDCVLGIVLRVIHRYPVCLFLILIYTCMYAVSLFPRKILHFFVPTKYQLQK